MAAYNLSHLGIVQPVNVEGVVTELQTAGKPVLFLIDEHHTTPDCITQNIANLTELVAKAGVKLIGVESHMLGDASPVTACNDHPEVANNFLGQAGVTVVGVESAELFAQMEEDIYNGRWVAGAKTHPNNYLRSYSYLAGLFRLRREKNLDGNLALNAGRAHIDHIAEMVRCGRADELAGQAVHYVRVRATAYPTL